MITETEHLQSMYAMVCICIFQAYRLGEPLKGLSCFVKRNHVTIWNWIQKYRPQKVIDQRKKISEFIIDETLVKVGSEYIWFGLRLNQKISKFSHYPYPRKETCLLLRDLFRV